jgi:cation transport ATPase
MVVSTVAGRIRVRSNRLKSKKVADEVRQRAAKLDGVTQARVNPAAGSLVVTYDPGLVDTIELEDALEALCLDTAAAPRKLVSRDVSRHLNRATKLGMMATLGTSLAYGFAGKKKPHIGFGAAFLAFAGMHMLRYQNTLVR